MPQFVNNIHPASADTPTRRSSDAGGLGKIIARTAKAIPMFFVVSLISCTLGYYVFHIPLDQLGIVVAVPCVAGFIMLRILATVMPAAPRESDTGPSNSFRVLALLAVVAAFVAADFLCSAVIYYGSGFKHLVIGTLTIAAGSAGTALLFVILAVAAETSELWHTAFMAILNLLRSQTIFQPPDWRKETWSR